MSDTTEHAVIAIFEDTTQAEKVAHDLMAWDKANDDVKLGAIGMLSREPGDWDSGKIKTKNFSSRNTGKGAKVGMGLGVLAAVFSGGLTLVPTVVGGAVAGGAIGALSHKSLGLTDEELTGLGKELEGGRGALLVMCDEGEVKATSDFLASAGGTVRGGAVDTQALEAASSQAGNAEKQSSSG